MNNSVSIKEKLWTRNFILLGASNLFMAIAFYFLIATLPIFLMKHLRIEEGLSGLILASYTLAALLIRPLSGYALDAYGRKYIFLISFFLFSTAFIGYGLTFYVSSLFLLRFTHGLLWGTLTTGGSTLLIDVIPPSRRGEGIGYYGLSMTIAMAVGPFLGLMVSTGDSYMKMFIAASIVSFIGFFLTLFIQYSDHPFRDSKSLSLDNLLESKAIPVSFNMLIISISYGALLSFISLYGRENRISNPGIFFIIFAIGITFSRIISGKEYDKKGPWKITIVGLLSLIAGYLMLALWRSQLGFLTSALFIGIGNGIIIPTFQAMINHIVDPQKRGIANSTYLTGFDLGVGIGTVGMGFLAHLFSLSTGFLCCSVVLLLGSLIFIKGSYMHFIKYSVSMEE
jgi:predicted MFS family arabinose efflux permease